MEATIQKKIKELHKSFNDTIKSAFDVALKLELEIGAKRDRETAQMAKVKQ